MINVPEVRYEASSGYIVVSISDNSAFISIYSSSLSPIPALMKAVPISMVAHFLPSIAAIAKPIFTFLSATVGECLSG